MLSAERIRAGPADISNDHEECAIVGLALFFGDGMLTPAITVLSTNSSAARDG